MSDLCRRRPRLLKFYRQDTPKDPGAGVRPGPEGIAKRPHRGQGVPLAKLSGYAVVERNV